MTALTDSILITCNLNQEGGNTTKPSKRRLALTVSLLLLGTGCRSKTPAQYIEPERFAQIYLQAVEQLVEIEENDSLAVAQKDSLKALLFSDTASLDSILVKNHTTRAEFEQSEHYFDEHPELWLEVFTIIEKKLTDLEKGVSQQPTKPPAEAAKSSPSDLRRPVRQK